MNRELKCPYCGFEEDISFFPDLFCEFETCKQYQEQNLLLQEIQKEGYNVVTCGECGEAFLHRTEIFEK